MKKKEKIPVFILLFLSFLLCFFKLDQNPTFISDEASIGYNAFSILKTGRDEWGRAFPLTFKAFGEHKLPLYIYASVLPVGIFKLSHFSTRFMSALSGFLSPVFIYLIACQLNPWPDKKIAFPLWVTFLFTINPWHFQTNRLALEANLALFLFLIGFWLILKKKLSWAAVFLSLTLYTYNACRLFVPLFLFLSLIFKKRSLKEIGRPISIFLILSLPLFFSGFRGSQERVFKTAFFHDPGLIQRIEVRRNRCQNRLNQTLCRLVFNRPVTYSSEFFKNYLSHFSPRFLFRGADLAQYSLPEQGIVYFFELPLLIYGLWYLSSKENLKNILLPWLVAAPVANSLTGPAHPVRSLVLMPVFPILGGLGIACFLLKLPRLKSVFSKTLIGLSLVSSVFFLKEYFFTYPTQTGSIWQAGYQPLFNYLDLYNGPHQRVITKFYGEPHIFDLFYHARYDGFDPRIFQSSTNGLVVRYDRQDHWVNFDRYADAFYWEQNDYPTWEKLVEKNQGDVDLFTLIALAPWESLPEKEPADFVYYPNGEVAFKIYQFNQPTK
ncbi:MAG: hypothetical protein JW991_05780 [Candidatus Pacebacteria bacterium]|nr:hypothetical protein [Candidatus Paceibacterota bacterium]